MRRGGQEATGSQAGDRRHSEKGERLLSAEVFGHSGYVAEIATLDIAREALERAAHLLGIAAHGALIRLFELGADFLEGRCYSADLSCGQVLLVFDGAADRFLGLFRLLVGELPELIQVLMYGLLQGTVVANLPSP
jgi:hypothetical protein